MRHRHTFAVCAYKESPYLEECLQSLNAQTNKSTIIVATSTPNDHIKNLSYKYKAKYIINERKHTGIADDWNFAYHNAMTDYVTLCHQDDLYHPRYIEKAAHFIDAFKDILIIFTGYQELRESGTESLNLNLLIKKILMLPLKAPDFRNNRFIRRRVLSLGSPICCPSVIYNKNKLGDFEFSDNYKCNLDWDAWERISKMQGKFIYIPESLMKHRIHQKSATTDLITQRIRSREDLALFKRFWPDPIASILHGLYSNAEKNNQKG